MLVCLWWGEDWKLFGAGIIVCMEMPRATAGAMVTYTLTGF